MKKSYHILLLLLITVLSVKHANAQVSDTSRLFKTLKTADSLVFSVGYNKCDISQFEQLIGDDFEFYHDQGGYIHTKEGFINSIKTNICSGSFKARRELVEGSLKVYPLYNNGVLYAALQMGLHRFYQTNKGKPERLSGIAQFTTLWVKNGDKWQMKRILSYDHKDDPLPGIGEAQMFDDDAAINSWLAVNHVPAVGIGIIENGKLQDVKVYGELKKGDPAPYNAIFTIASLTKPITSMLTLKLVSMGKWDLDEPLDHYWIDPDVKDDPRHKKLTTRIILSHQSGFANWRYLNADKKLHFEFEPGTKYQYSGEGFEYLRRALEHKFHTTLDKLADSLIFKPLSMHDTHYVWSDEIDTNRLAHGFDPNGNMYPVIKNTTANAADMVHTTIVDYGAFVVAVMNGKLFTQSIYDQMITHQVRTKGDKYMGLGWEVYDIGNGHYALGHGGSEQGVHTQVFILPQSKKGLIIFTNVDDGYKVYTKLLDQYLGTDGRKILALELQ
ncbi:CubicO group peptidase, beta-lactamase class C family [Mucilaginibacter mallensis]|uniref:CubicO group peptidase, beta-lactamase class C family n=1 Tax=Mucilaginibacter mallensis TaxID=652787 RepID=A0A1H1WSQ8_MUCMA|nr:serine hydrolase [Mucilaginibacter mallensis]SDT00104.1 CubicO group peptidase, beta-lactamase class C family [Mucilaginibacter mallensis]